MSLTGCSPAITGAIAVGLDDAGQPVVVLAACPDALSRLSVGIDHPEWEDVELVRELRRDVPLREEDGFESVALAAPASPWGVVPTGGQRDLDDATEYLVGASNSNGTATTGSVAFRLDVLADLPEESVLASVDGGTRQVTVRRFTETACGR
jgi:hypothetical protein